MFSVTFLSISSSFFFFSVLLFPFMFFSFLLLQAIISSPNKRLSIESRELLWRFRYSLIEDKRALVKFNRCVNWADPLEIKQALDLLYIWQPIDLADALELLSASFTNEDLRAYAVKQLHRADNEVCDIYIFNNLLLLITPCYHLFFVVVISLTHHDRVCSFICLFCYVLFIIIIVIIFV